MSSFPDLVNAPKSVAVARDHAVLSTPQADHVFRVDSGLFAVEVQVPGVRRRVLDLLLPSDVVSSRSLVGFSEIRLRAIEAGRVWRQVRRTWLSEQSCESVQACAECCAMRAHLTNAIVGLPDADGRVASLLFTLLTRHRQLDTWRPGLELQLPRDDVADYILVNPDTLSRCLSRLRDADVIARSHRNGVVIKDPDRLAAASPLAKVIENGFPDTEVPV